MPMKAIPGYFFKDLGRDFSAEFESLRFSLVR